MVKLNAPMLSLGASGKLGDAIVYATWKGRPYARQLVYPANPRSGGQVGMRSMMKFLSQNWDALPANKKATWEDRAEDGVYSPFNAYVSLNLARWRNFLGPGMCDPPTESETPTEITAEAATAGVRQISLGWDLSGMADNWGLAIFRQTTTPVVTGWSNCIACRLCATNASFVYVDTPLDPGTYYYNFRVFGVDGKLAAQETEVDATVT